MSQVLTITCCAFLTPISVSSLPAVSALLRLCSHFDEQEHVNNESMRLCQYSGESPLFGGGMCVERSTSRDSGVHDSRWRLWSYAP
jgi:hypothetical protein